METNALAPPNLGQSEPSLTGENAALSPENLQAALVKLFNQGTPSSQIAQGLLNTFPQYYQMGMNTLSLLQFQAALLESVKTSFEPHYSYVFDLLYQSLLWNNPDRLLDICATRCNRRDYAFCEVAVDYIEKNYEPSWYELKALRNKLYKTYKSGASPSAILALVTSKNQKFRQLAETIAEIAVQYPCTNTLNTRERAKSSPSRGGLREIPPLLDTAESIEEPVDYWLEDDSNLDNAQNDSPDLSPIYPAASELSVTLPTAPDTFSKQPSYSKVVRLNSKASLLLSQYEEKDLLDTVASLEISTDTRFKTWGFGVLF